MAHAPLTIMSTPRARVFDLSRWYLWSTRYAARIRSRIAPELRTIAPSSNGGGLFFIRTASPRYLIFYVKREA